jgi:hypothetical protein
VSIKQDAHGVYFINHPEERTLAQSLGEAFDITYGDRFRGFSFWFAAPQDHARERFGLREDEVLVLYSSYDTVDARALRVIRDIQADRRFDYRLDPILVLFIHHSDPVRTQEFLYASEQERVIVPFNADELFNSSRGPIFIRQRIAEFFGDKDLFGLTSPITTDKYFFGRKKLVQDLVARSTAHAENSGVFGLRRTGKTSVLRAAERRVSRRPSVLVEYIDCQNPGIYRVRWWQMLQNIVERLHGNLARRLKRKIEIRSEYSETNAGTRFSSGIQTLLSVGGLERIIIMLDEIEFITPKISGQPSQHWDEDFVPFWQTIRATHHELHGGLVFIVAGVNPSCVQEARFGETPNPIFQLALPHFLRPFQHKDVRDMVRYIGRYSGLKFDEDVYEYLRDKFGGHPFLIRAACSEVWQRMASSDPQRHVEVSVSDFEQRDAQIRARLSQPIKEILLSLVWWHPEEYELLQILAEGDTEFVEKYVQVSPNAIVQFQHYGVLKDSNTTEFAIDYVRDFLLNNGDDYKNEVSPFTRSEVPVDVLPEVPDLKVLGDLHNKLSDIELRLRRTILLYIGFEVAWKDQKIAEKIIHSLSRRPDGSHPSALFSGRRPQAAINQLYLLDLKSIILGNWDTFGLLFDGDQPQFKMCMDIINDVRNLQAHTKPVSTTEVAAFDSSYRWMLLKLEPVAAGADR